MSTRSPRRRPSTLLPAVIVVASVLLLVPGCGRDSNRGVVDEPVLPAYLEPEQPEPGRSKPYVFPVRAANILLRSISITLLSLDPQNHAIAPTGFHKWPVLGQVLVGRASHHGLVKQLVTGVAPQSTPIAACFNPRHGVHAVSSTDFADLVICFECNWVRVYYSDGTTESYVPSQSPREFLSSVLMQVKIPLAPRK